MSNIFRKSYTLPIPEGAERVTVKGVPSVRFKRKGKSVTAPLTAAGDRVRLQSPFWYGRVAREVVKLFTDAVASQQRLAELLRKSERKESGVADPFKESRLKPIAEHLRDYLRFLEAAGNCPEYIAQTSARIGVILNGCKFIRISDLSPERVSEFLHGLRRNPPRPVLPVGKAEYTPAELTSALGGDRPVKLARVIARERLEAGTGNGPNRLYPRATVERLQDIYCRGISIATSNGYLTAMKCFSRWLVEKERVDRDRLVSLSRLNANTDRRHERRALEESELNGLLSAAWESASTFEGLTGKDRAMIYMLAMTSGLRASELASVTPGSFDLATHGPTVTVRAAYTKNRNEAEQPLPADVAAAFSDYLKDRPPLSPLWPGRWNELGAEMLRGDLSAAGILYRDAEGNVADFHALRHSYISLLGRCGASPKVTQTLARHSDIRLTMNVYSHAQIHDLAAAVEGLPISLPSGKPMTSGALKATGTDGRNLTTQRPSTTDAKRLPFPCRDGDETCKTMTNGDEPSSSDDDDEESSQAIAVIGDDESCGIMPNSEEETTPPGFEPGQREPKSLVLPLHYGVKIAEFAATHCLYSLCFDTTFGRFRHVWAVFGAFWHRWVTDG